MRFSKAQLSLYIINALRDFLRFITCGYFETEEQRSFRLANNIIDRNALNRQDHTFKNLENLKEEKNNNDVIIENTINLEKFWESSQEKWNENKNKNPNVIKPEGDSSESEESKLEEKNIRDMIDRNTVQKLVDENMSLLINNSNKVKGVDTRSEWATNDIYHRVTPKNAVVDRSGQVLQTIHESENIGASNCCDWW